MKKILIISTSLRGDSNSEFYARELARGAADAGHDTELITLAGKKLAFCLGCLACQATERCVIDDDAIAIAEKVKRAEVLVFATPVYYYGMSGQMKTLLDRLNPLFPAEYAFREVYLVATAADSDESAIDGTVIGMEGWLSCFENARLAGVLRGVGTGDAGDAKNHAAILKRAYALGKAIE